MRGVMSALPTPARRGAACACCAAASGASSTSAARRRLTPASVPACGAAHAGSMDTVRRVLEVRELTKRYDANLAVDGLSFAAQPGRVLGFLGPNGAGKTTTLRMLLGLTLPTSGTADRGRPPLPRAGSAGEPGGRGARGPAVPSRPHRAQSPAGRRDGRGGSRASRVEEVLRLVELDGAGNKRVKAYSLGMRQRLSLAGALLGDPQALVLDEPANGLDPQGIRWLRDFLRSQASDGPHGAGVEPRAGGDGPDGGRGRGDQPREARCPGLARRADPGRRGARVGAEPGGGAAARGARARRATSPRPARPAPTGWPCGGRRSRRSAPRPPRTASPSTSCTGRARRSRACSSSSPAAAPRRAGDAPGLSRAPEAPHDADLLGARGLHVRADPADRDPVADPGRRRARLEREHRALAAHHRGARRAPDARARCGGRCGRVQARHDRLDAARDSATACARRGRRRSPARWVGSSWASRHRPSSP